MADVTREVLLSGSPTLPQAPVERAWQPGDVLNSRYLITAVLGEGGMGRVYRVDDALHPERRVALKTLGAAFSQASRVELFKAEFRTMSELSHPHIARVYDFENVGTTSAFTMELIEGRDLFAASESQPTERILDWTVEACRALQYLHSRGVIHADFKPHNVLVSGGSVRVLDFGLSGGVGAGLMLGTPVYMAPELSRGKPADARVDLYALGITLYQLLVRRVPFTAANLDELRAQHERSPLPIADGVDAKLRAVLERLCAKKPEDRFATANAVIAALSEATSRPYALETSATRNSYIVSGKLVGRDAEKQQVLEHCLARAGDGAGGDALMVTLSGPSGVGKSRLMRDVRMQLQLVGLPVLEATCYEGSFGELEPLRAWGEAVRRLCRARGRAALEERHAAMLEWLRAGEKSVRPSEDESLRMERLRELADFILELAATEGLILYLSDLQWGRSSTTDFLRLLSQRHAARRDAGEPGKLALVISYRDDEVEGPLAELLSMVAARRRLSIPLAPLSPAQTAELIGAMLGTSSVPETFSARVSLETGGNPFFIEEVIRAVMERGDVYLAAGQWAARTDAAHLEVPATIAAVLERRLSSLPPWQRELLDWSAVYAQPMPLLVLAEVAERPLEEIAVDVRALAERQLANLMQDERVHPAHDKLRQYLYGRLDGAVRVARHRRVAQALEKLAPGEDEFVFERAHHWWHAGDDDAARIWAEKAATLGERSFATDLAIENHQRLRKLAKDQATRRHSTERLFELMLIAGHYARVLALADEELQRQTAPLERAHLRQLRGEALAGQGQLALAIEELREVTALLGDRVPRGRRRRWFLAKHFLRHLIRLQLLRGDLSRPAQLSDEERRRREILGRSYLQMAVCSLLTGDDEGFGVNFAGLNHALALGAHEVTRRLLQNVALGHHLMGRYRASQRLILLAQKLAVSEADRAMVRTVEVLSRQSTQVPMFPGQPPVYAYERQMIDAIDLLSTRSRAQFGNLAKVVATTVVWLFAPRFRHRPEVARWAETMRGTVHHCFVQGAAAVMARIEGEKQRSIEAYELTREAGATPFYRAWVDVNLAYVCAISGDLSDALGYLRSAAALMRSLETRTATALTVPSLAVGVTLVLAARGVNEAWLRALNQDSVARLDRAGRKMPPYFILVREAGRMALGRSSLAAMRRQREAARATFIREQSISGYPDGMLVGALALAQAAQPEWRTWAKETLEIFEARYPPKYAEHVGQLLTR